jgi:hypothetical protein
MKPGVGSILMVYGLTACVFFIIDLFWLGLAAKGLYQRHIGELLRAQVNRRDRGVCLDSGATGWCRHRSDSRNGRVAGFFRLQHF